MKLSTVEIETTRLRLWIALTVQSWSGSNCYSMLLGVTEP